LQDLRVKILSSVNDITQSIHSFYGYRKHVRKIYYFSWELSDMFSVNDGVHGCGAFM